MVKETYISFETARLLKEKGFDEECICYYDDEGVFNSCTIKPPFINHEFSSYFTAPTHQMAMKWLREVHNLFIVIDIGFNIYTSDFYYTATVHKLDDDIAYPVNQINNGEYRNPEMASEDAIKYCLTNLI